MTCSLSTLGRVKGQPASWVIKALRHVSLKAVIYATEIAVPEVVLRPSVIELGPRSKSVLVYYTVLAVGLALMVLYLWWAITYASSDSLRPLLVADYLFFTASTLAISLSKKRSGRIALTILSGVSGGIEGYFDLLLHPESYSGLTLFLLGAFGVLLVLASISSLGELSKKK